MILKNINSLIRRFPAAVILNFTGLVASFLAFALIFIQADYELSFDKCHPTAERVFRIDKEGDESMFRNILPRGFADDIILSSSHIETGCTIFPYLGETFFTIEQEGKSPIGYKRNMTAVSDRFIDVFGLTMLEGDTHSLDIAGSVIIPQSLAEILFPDGTAVGKKLKADVSMLESSGGEATISGIYKDLPSNTQLGNDIYMTVGDYQIGSYGGANFICYLLLDDADNAGAVADEFNGNFDFAPFAGWLSPIELVPLTSIYFRNEGNIYKSGIRGQLLLLIAIAFMILAIGLINFTNFYLAQTPLRIRKINLQKILGSSSLSLRVQVVAESVIWCVAAYGVSALLLIPASETLATEGVLMQAFSISLHWDLLLGVGILALVTGVIAGIWPGIYSTSGNPAMVIRGNYGLSESGRNLRTSLVGLQFVMSIALLIFVLFVQRQSKFMQDYPCGYEKDNLAVINISRDDSKTKSEWLRNQLKQLPEIEDVAYSTVLAGGSENYPTSSYDFGDGPVQMSMIYCSDNFPPVFGLQVTEGRNFHEGDLGSVLMTQDLKAHGASVRGYGDEAGKESQVVGFVKEVIITSMRKASAPVCFIATDPNGIFTMQYAYVKLSAGADKVAATNRIKTVLTEMNPTWPFEIQFYDSIGKSFYSGDERLRISVWLFSCLAVLLSLVGIWGQVLMDVQYKRTEISVKRVLGAEVERIAFEGLRTYLRILAVCYVIAAPISWAVVRVYLQQFTHQVGFRPLIFLIALIVVTLLCSAVVLYHYLKVARTNPAEELKKE